MDNEPQEQVAPAAVYVPWPTFKAALEQLSQGVPNVIDKSVFPKVPWGVQPQLLAGLKFLGLIDEGGNPTQLLYSVAVPSEADRKRALKEVIKKCYPALFDLDLTKTTPLELAGQMQTSYNVSGDTRTKAVRFFMGAVKYLGIPFSPLLNVPGTANGTSSRKRRGRKPKTTPEAEAKSTPPPASPGDIGIRKAIQLSTPDVGLTLTVSADFGALAATDRKLVAKLIDELEEYERASATEGLLTVEQGNADQPK